MNSSPLNPPKLLLFIILLIILNPLYGYTLKDLSPKIRQSNEFNRGTILCDYDYYQVSYSTQNKQPLWTIHTLKTKMIKGKAKRSNRFVVDEKIKDYSATDDDYKRSGYDRGHLVPAADMKWSQKANNFTFYYTNMSPQDPDFNRGIWNELEEQVRLWSKEHPELHIISGAVFAKDMEFIGNNVSVAPNFYKIIAFLPTAKQKSKIIAFLLPNQNSNQSIEKFVVTTTKIEELTGLDFFSILPDDLEKRLEQKSSFKDWNKNEIIKDLKKDFLKIIKKK